MEWIRNRQWEITEIRLGDPVVGPFTALRAELAWTLVAAVPAELGGALGLLVQRICRNRFSRTSPI